jgi:predicted permease
VLPLQFIAALNAPPPFRDGDRIVGIEYSAVGAQRRRIVQDFEIWRERLQSFESLAAYSLNVQNLVGDDGRAEAVSAPQITASAFAMLGVAPVLGRSLLESDEAPGAEPVALLENDFWRRRFGGDSTIVGKRIRLGAMLRTVVAVMPPGFKFPNRGDQMWIPLQARGVDYPADGGPMLWVFGRLKPGVSRDEAKAEVQAFGTRVIEDGNGRRFLRPTVLSFTLAATGLRPTLRQVFMMNLVALLLLTVACGNVGTLILARTAARSTEIAVRRALGAGRGRIVTQLFLEAFALATLAATAGLVTGHFVATKFEPQWNGIPAWIHLGVTPKTAALGLALAIFSATIAGAIPALKATSEKIQRVLQGTATKSSGLRFGLGASALIVAEIALAVGLLSVVSTMALNLVRDPSNDTGIPGRDFLAARVTLVAEPDMRLQPAAAEQAWSVRYATDLQGLTRRLAAEPYVRGVALGNALPGMPHIRARVAVDGEPSNPQGSVGSIVQTAAVHPGFFEGLGQRVRQGRDFGPRDFEAVQIANAAKPIIVNESFVTMVLRGQPAVGRRIRFVNMSKPPEEWPVSEIVGVVRDLGMSVANRELAAGVYRPSPLGEMNPIYVAIHVATNPSSFAPRLRSVAAAVDPELLIGDPVPLEDEVRETLREARLTSYGFAAIAAIALVLSAAGLYALMSFTVAARTYEIAVRVALGARRAHVVRLIAFRVLGQLAVGAVLGGVIGTVLGSVFATSATTSSPMVAVALTLAAVMTLIGLTACAVPTLRALRIEPIRALKEGV